MKTWLVLWCVLISKTVPENTKPEAERRQLGKEILKALRNGFYNNHDSDEPDTSRPVNSIEEQAKKPLIANVPQPKPTQRPNNKGKFANISMSDNNDKKEENAPGKYTNVNFVLYNRGIKFQKQDDSTNILKKQKLRFNCILVVATANKCYGWEMGSKGNKTHNHSPDGKKKKHKTKKKNRKDKVKKEKAKGARISARRQLETMPQLPTYNIYL